MRFFSAIAFAFAFSFASQAQTTDQSYTIEEYVTDVLIGDGINVSNITFTGSEEQIGYMSGAGGVFSVDAGVVLSTDNALNLTDPACGANACTGCLGGGIDQDLLDVANSVPPLIGQAFTVSSVNDLCILEFDFEAAGDSISFNYVFGSDEYLEWVNSTYNDIFAFFLSGPGITGPYASPAGFPDGAINIAQVPDSDPLLPITISSVNDVTNPMYYIDNFNNEGICIDGYTQTFTAEAQVQCGEIYHIKLAIADGSDNALESFVILEDGSFSSNAIDLIADASIEGAEVFLGDTTVVEGCNDAIFTVVRPDDSELDTIFLNIDPSSTAFPGSDYNADIEMVIMQPGQSSANISLGVINDNSIEGPEHVTLQYEYVNGCGDTVVASATIVIFDPNPITLLTDPVGCLDENDGITLSVEPLSGYGPYSYQWYIYENVYLYYDDGTPVLDDEGNHLFEYQAVEIGTEPSFYYDTGGVSDSAFVDVIDVCGSIAQATIPWQALEPYIGGELELCYGIDGNIPVEGGTYAYNNIGDSANVFSEILAYQGEDEDGNEIWVDIIGNDSIIHVLGNQDPNTGLYFGNFLTGESGIGSLDLQLVDGCGNITFAEVTVDYCALEFCNVFTPDNDGPNQNFKIVGIQGHMPAKFYVYDRWGQLVFEDINWNGTWDGKRNNLELSDGVYYYVLRINYDYDQDPELEELYDSDLYYFVNVTKPEPGVVEFMGNVSILRKQ